MTVSNFETAKLQNLPFLFFLSFLASTLGLLSSSISVSLLMSSGGLFLLFVFSGMLKGCK